MSVSFDNEKYELLLKDYNYPTHPYLLNELKKDCTKIDLTNFESYSDCDIYKCETLYIENWNEKVQDALQIKNMFNFDMILDYEFSDSSIKTVKYQINEFVFYLPKKCPIPIRKMNYQMVHLIDCPKPISVKVGKFLYDVNLDEHKFNFEGGFLKCKDGFCQFHLIN